MIIIDAKEKIVGRVATVAAKQALLGNEVAVINCADAVFSGPRKRVVADWKHRAQMGVPRKGPFVHRSADRIVRRVIRGMLPYKKPRGSAAFKRIKCYTGGKEFKGDVLDLPGASIDKLPTMKFTTVKMLVSDLKTNE